MPVVLPVRETVFAIPNFLALCSIYILAITIRLFVVYLL
jgi:hypothetical protein